MASSSAHGKNTTGHDKNAYAKIDHKNTVHDKNAHAKNDHHAKDDHAKNAHAHAKNDHAKVDAHGKNTNAKNDHAKDVHDHKSTHFPAKNDHAKGAEAHDKNTHGKDVHDKSTHFPAKNDHAKGAEAHDRNTHGKDVHDKSTHFPAKNDHAKGAEAHDRNTHAKDVHDKSTHFPAKNDHAKGADTHTHAKDVHDKSTHFPAKNDHAKGVEAHDRNTHAKDVDHDKGTHSHTKDVHAHDKNDYDHDKNVVHGKPVHSKSDHDKGAVQDKSVVVANINNDMFLARCPERGEHEFMVRNGTEHFWCGRCGQDGSGMRYKCEHCNYRLHENCYRARLEIKCPMRHEGHNYISREGPTPFMCNGCREIGVGVRHKCALCHYRLHDKCYQLQKECKYGPARAPTATNANFPGKVFHFIPQHPGNYPGQVCTPCGRNVCGFIFKATDANGKKVFLHPLCSDVRKEWDLLGMKFLVQHQAKAKCLVCQKKKSKGWSYASSCEKYSLHVACAMDLVLRSWKEGRLEEAKMQKYLDYVDLDELAEKLERSTSMGKTFKKGGIILLKFVTDMILGNPKPIGGVIIGLLT